MSWVKWPQDDGWWAGLLTPPVGLIAAYYVNVAGDALPVPRGYFGGALFLGTALPSLVGRLTQSGEQMLTQSGDTFITQSST
jgi:hypothetical protein